MHAASDAIFLHLLRTAPLPHALLPGHPPLISLSPSLPPSLPLPPPPIPPPLSLFLTLSLPSSLSIPLSPLLASSISCVLPRFSTHS